MDDFFDNGGWKPQNARPVWFPRFRMPPRHFLDIADLSPDELVGVLDTADKIRTRVDGNVQLRRRVLRDQAIAFLTSKQSLRTGGAIAQAATRLGGKAETFSGNSMVDETGKTREPLTHMTECLQAQAYPVVFARLHKHEDIVQMSKVAGKTSVVNALTDQSHPLQALADIATLRRAKPGVQRPKVVFMADGNNVATSLGEASAMLGWDFVHSGPQERRIRNDRWEGMQHMASDSGATVTYEENPDAAVEGADMVYADVFASMGEKGKAAELKALLSRYKVTAKLMERAGPQALFGHCLPAEEAEVEPEVLHGPNSIVFPIAGARMDTTAAIIQLLLHDREVYSGNRLVRGAQRTYRSMVKNG